MSAIMCGFFQIHVTLHGNANWFYRFEMHLSERIEKKVTNRSIQAHNLKNHFFISMKGRVRKALTSFSDQHIELLIRMYYVRKAIIFICRIVLFSEFLLETHEARTFKIKWDCHIETISGLMEVERTKKRRLITFRTMMATHRFWPLRHIRVQWRYFLKR